MGYNFKDIEKKWQNKWYSEGTFYAKDDPSLKKWYGLVEFPYPSGQGLHVGHPRSYTALDIIARRKRMEDIMYYTLLDLMHLDYQLKTMLLKIMFILKLQLRKTLIILENN